MNLATEKIILEGIRDHEERLRVLEVQRVPKIEIESEAVKTKIMIYTTLGSFIGSTLVGLLIFFLTKK